MEKITEKQTEVETALSETSGWCMSQLDPRVLEVYRGVREVRPKQLCPAAPQMPRRAPRPLCPLSLSDAVSILILCRRVCVLTAVCVAWVTEGPGELLRDNLLSTVLGMVLSYQRC